MLAKITVNDIDYRKTLDSLYPVLTDMLKEKSDFGFLIKLLKKIGNDTAKTILLSILDNMDETEKKRIICGAVNENYIQIEEQINKILGEHGLPVSVHGLYAYMDRECISICADKTEADLGGIMESDAVNDAVTQKAEQFGIKLPKGLTTGLAGFLGNAVNNTPSAVKQKIIDSFRTGRNRDKFLSAVQDALSSWVSLTVTDVELELEPVSKTGVPLLKVTDMLSENSDTWQDKITDAIALFIKNAVHK